MYGFEISMELVGVSVKTIRQVQIPSQITFKRLHEIIKSEPSGEIIIAPEIDSEMESIMQEIENEKETSLE